jgi:hypothetical protein
VRTNSSADQAGRRSYVDSAAAHGITTLDAMRSAIAGKPWLPPLPAISRRSSGTP